MLRVIIKGKQGAGKSTLAGKLSAMLRSEGVSYSFQDGEETYVHKNGCDVTQKVTVAIIVKQA